MIEICFCSCLKQHISHISTCFGSIYNYNSTNDVPPLPFVNIRLMSYKSIDILTQVFLSIIEHLVVVNTFIWPSPFELKITLCLELIVQTSRANPQSFLELDRFHIFVITQQIQRQSPYHHFYFIN